MPDASPRESESPIPDIKPEERGSKEGSPKEQGESSKPDYFRQALLNLKQLDQEKKSASQSPKEEVSSPTAEKSSSSKAIPSAQALRDPRVRKLVGNDPAFLQKIVDITKKTDASKESKGEEPRPYSPSDALLDTSDDFEAMEKPIFTLSEAKPKISQVVEKEEPVTSYVSSSTSAYIPPSGRSIFGTKAEPTKPTDLSGLAIASQPSSEQVNFDFSSWRGDTKRRDSGPMSPLGLQIDEDQDESIAEPTVSSTTDNNNQHKEDEIEEPAESHRVLVKEPKMIPLNSAEDQASPNIIGESWRKLPSTKSTEDSDLRDPCRNPPQISPSSTSNFVLPDLSRPPILKVKDTFI